MSHYANLWGSIDVPGSSSTAIIRIDDNNGNRFLRNVGIYSVTLPVALRSVQNFSLFERRGPLLRHRSPQDLSPVSPYTRKFGTQITDGRTPKDKFSRSQPWKPQISQIYNDKVIYSVKTQHILIINTINWVGAHIICAHPLNVPLLCFKNWPEDGSMSRNLSPSL